jgi:peptide/nickel transport system substrate-binding protein
MGLLEVEPSCPGVTAGGSPAKQRSLIRDLEKYVLDTETHAIFLLWYYRMVPHRSYVKGWKISPSHYLNQDLATIWLDE